MIRTHRDSICVVVVLAVCITTLLMHASQCTTCFATVAPPGPQIVWYESAGGSAVKIFHEGDWYYSQWSDEKAQYYTWFDSKGERLSFSAGIPFVVDAPEMRAIYVENYHTTVGARLVKDGSQPPSAPD